MQKNSMSIENKTRLFVLLDKKILQYLRIEALINDINVSELISGLYEKHLDSYKEGVFLRKRKELNKNKVGFGIYLDKVLYNRIKEKIKDDGLKFDELTTFIIDTEYNVRKKMNISDYVRIEDVKN